MTRGTASPAPGTVSAGRPNASPNYPARAPKSLPGARVLGPDDDVEQASRLVRERAVRRIPVVQDGIPVGVVSLGDLALEKDQASALSQVSAAPPNR